MAGIVKAYNVSFEYAVHDMSYLNAVMYNRVLPSYDRAGGKTDGDTVRVDGDDPERMNEILSHLY